MAQQEEPREDLLREAVALVTRAELKLQGLPEPVVVGFREGGEASFFFGEDPVYQFNDRLQLRRAYRAGLLLKAEAGHLVAMRRERSEGKSLLVSQLLTAESQAELLDEAEEKLAALQQALVAGEYELVGQVSSSGDVVPQILAWLATHAGRMEVAGWPNVR